MKHLKKNLVKRNQEPSLKASRIRAYVDPILKLLIAIRIRDIFELLIKNKDRIDNSIINNIEIARNIVLMDLSNKNDNKLLVK